MQVYTIEVKNEAGKVVDRFGLKAANNFSMAMALQCSADPDIRVNYPHSYAPSVDTPFCSMCIWGKSHPCHTED